MFSKKIFTLAIISTAFISISVGAFATSSWVDYPCDPVVLSPQVCFYTGVNYTGNWYCESGERTVNEMNKAPWKNNIESIKLIDEASVKIYNQYNREGDYVLIEKSIKQLNSDFFNKVKSYRTVKPYIEETHVPSWWYQEMCRH